MPRKPANPVLAAFATEAAATGVRVPTGDEIYCSVPGCTGIVGPKFVLELSTGKAGLCPKKEKHLELQTADKTGQVRAIIAALLHFGRKAVADKAKA